MNLGKWMKGCLIGAASLGIMGLSAQDTSWPDASVDLNNFPPETPIGEYVEYLSSNVVNQVVVLTNGVLSVNGETINVAEPSKEVVETNTVDGVEVITTNTYYAVYDPDPNLSLKDYATIYKYTYYTNELGQVEITTNEVAYLSNIASDSEKADKTIKVWDFWCDAVEGFLRMEDSSVAPFAYWAWRGRANGYTSIALYYNEGVWSLDVVGDAVNTNVTQSADFDIANLSFSVAGETISFARANDRSPAFVVYTDRLEQEKEDFIKNELSKFVSRTNLNSISREITEDKLHTIGNIANILRNIRNQLNTIAGDSSIKLSYKTISSGTTTIRTTTPFYTDDTVEIDWGDGTTQTTSPPTSHVYSSARTPGEINVVGYIKEIAGQSSSNPWVSGTASPANLTNVTMGVNVGLEIVGDYAFYGCSSLTNNLEFLPSSVNEIKTYAFSQSGISSLEGMPKVKAIGNYAFYGCSNLTSLNGISSSVTNCGNYAFSNCANLQSLNGIVSGSKLSSLETYCFYSNAKLKSIAALANATDITTIPNYCFSKCGNLASLEGLPEGITSIGTHAFSYAYSLPSLDGIPTTVTSIGGSAFLNDTNMTSAAALWKTQCASIGGNAFSGCKNLSDVILPSTITYISNTAFGNCSPNIRIRFLGKSCEEIMSLPKASTDLSSAFPWVSEPYDNVTFVGKDGIITYDTSTGSWVISENTTRFYLSSVPAGTHTISLGSIEVVALRDSSAPEYDYLVNWGGYAENTNLTQTVTLASTTDIVVSIYGKINSYTPNLGKPFIYLDGNSANPHLEKVEISECAGVAELGEGMFANCSNLTSIEGNLATITSIGANCFANDSAIADLGDVIGGMDSLESLPEGCFKNCKSITSITGIPEGVTSIGASCFSNCTALVSIDDIPSGVTEIPEACFHTCTGVTEIASALDNISTIGERAFFNCVGVENLILPQTISSIGENAFYEVGGAAEEQVDEDTIPYSVLIDCEDMTCANAVDKLQLEDGKIYSPSGIRQGIVKIECSDGALVYNTTATSESYHQWEIIVPAIDFSLTVDDGQEVTFSTYGLNPYQDAGVLINWGDGSVDKWTNNRTHTYTTQGNYTVRVKGLVESVQGDAVQGGCLRSVDGENTCLRGYNIPDSSPISYVGKYAFSKCPNLSRINTLDTSSTRSLKKKISRRGTSRLDELVSVLGDSIKVAYTNEATFRNSGLTSLAGLPDYTTSLGDSFFAYNASLSSLEGLPTGILDIGTNCFQGCTGLRALYGYPASLAYVPEGCFLDCTSLGMLTGISSEVTDIQPNAFYGCSSLYDMIGLGDSVTKIGSGSFSKSGLRSLEGMPSSVTTIGDGAFMQCPNLTSIGGISPNLEHMGRMAFMECYKLETVNGISEKITTITNYCFLGSSNLISATIPKTVTALGLSTFVGAGASAPLVEDIDSNKVAAEITFEGRSCAEIRELWGEDNFATTLPNTKLIGWDGYIVFQNGKWEDRIDTIHIKVTTASVSNVVCLGVSVLREETDMSVRWGDDSSDEMIAEPYSGEDIPGPEIGSAWGHMYEKPGTYDIYVKGQFTYIGSVNPPIPYVFAPTNKPSFTVDEFDIGNNVGLKKLGDSCFRGYTNLAKLYDMKDSAIIYIGTNCFDGCSSLSSLDGFPRLVDTIDYRAFAHCSSLENLYAVSNATIKSFGPEAFIGCSSLTSLIGLGNGYESLPSRCFAECNRLDNLAGISSALTNISEEAFIDCRSLASLEGLANTSVRTLGDRAFASCRGLQTLEGLPTNTLSSIGKECFMGCSSLVSLDAFTYVSIPLPEGCFRDCTKLASISALTEVEEVGNHCFSNCIALTSVKGFPSIDSVKTGVFADCSSLTNLTELPSSVTSLGAYSFFRCNNLSEFEVPASITNISEYAFAECTDIRKMTIGVNVESIGINALQNIGSGNDDWIDDDGWMGKTVVYFPDTDVTNIVSKMNYPWGANTNTTKFVGRDGFIIGPNYYREALEVDVNATSNLTIRCKGFVSSDGSPIWMSWGDGTQADIVESGTDVIQDHTYSLEQGGALKIKIYGKVCIIGIVTNRQMIGDRDITKVTIPLTSSATEIRSEAFINAVRLKTFECDIEGLKKIGQKAFSGCYSLDTIAGLQGTALTELEKDAFNGTAITTLSWMPNSILNIGDNVFSGTKLSSIDGNWNSMTNMGSGVFQNSTLGSDGVTVTIPDEWKTIPAYTFADCKELSELRLHNGIDSLGDGCFANLGLNVSSREDAEGNSYQAYVYMTSWDLNTAWERLGFTYDSRKGISTSSKVYKTTKFLCSDGYIAYVPEEKWMKYTYSLVMKFMAGSGSIQIGPIVSSDGQPTTWLDSFGEIISVPTGSTLTKNISSAFYLSCTSGNLMEVKGADSASWVSGAKSRLYYFASSLDSSSLTSIGDYAFANCVNLSDVIIGSSSITNIGNHAFENCHALGGYTSVPTFYVHNLTSIGASAFKGCTNVTALSFGGSSLETIGAEAFSGCTHLETLCLAARGFTKLTIGLNAFAELGADLTKRGIDEYGNRYHSTIWFGGYDFNTYGYQGSWHGKCEDIMNVRGLDKSGTPDNVLFPSWDGVVVSKGGNEYDIQEYGIILTHLPWDERGGNVVGMRGIIPEPGTTFLVDWGDGIVQSGLTSAPSERWLMPNNGPDTEILIRGKIRQIGGGLYPFLQGASETAYPRLTNVKIGNRVGLTTIADYAFSGSSSLTNITGTVHPVTSLGEGTFTDCTSLEHIPIGFTNVVTVGKSCFEGCSRLIDCSALTPKCKVFGDKCFRSCSSLASLEWMNRGVTELGKECFLNCGSIVSLNGLPNTLTNIPYACFAYCGLTNLEGLPSTIKVIDSWAFSNNRNLTDLTGLSNLNSLEYLGHKVFGWHYRGDMPWEDEQSPYKPQSVNLRSVKFVGKQAFGFHSNSGSNLVVHLSNPEWPGVNYQLGMGIFTSGCTYTLHESIEDFYNKLTAGRKPNDSTFAPKPYGVVYAIGGMVRERGFVSIGPDGSLYTNIYNGATIKLSNTGTAELSVSLSGIDYSSEFNHFVDWGDGTVDSSASHTYGTAKPYEIHILGEIVRISGSDESSGCISVTNGYVSEVHLYNSQNLVLDNYALAGLTKCSLVKIHYGYGIITGFKTTATSFAHLGEELPVKSRFGKSVKATIELDGFIKGDFINLVGHSDRFGAPKETLFGLLDCYVYDGTEMFSGIEFTVTWKDYTEDIVKEYKYKPGYSWTCNGVSFLSGSAYHVPSLGYGNQLIKWGKTINVPGEVEVEIRKENIASRPLGIGPVYFRDAPYGFVKVGNDDKVRLGNGKYYDVPITRTTGEKTKTIRIYGHLQKIEKLADQTAPDRTGKLNGAKITNFKFGVACDISSVGNLQGIQISSYGSGTAREVPTGMVNHFARDDDSEDEETEEDTLEEEETPETTFIWLPDTIEELGVGCFEDTADIADLTWLPSSLTNIPDRCFANCSNLASLQLKTQTESGVETLVCTNIISIGREAFRNCLALQGRYEFSDQLQNVGYMAFQNVGQGQGGNLELVMTGKTTEEIQTMLEANDPDNRIHTYNPRNGATSRIHYYGSDGRFVADTCIEDSDGNFHSEYRVYGE